MGQQPSRKRERERCSRAFNEDSQGKSRNESINARNKEVNDMDVEKEKGPTWTTSVGENFDSPLRPKSMLVFFGPTITDVEKNVHVANRTLDEKWEITEGSAMDVCTSAKQKSRGKTCSWGTSVSPLKQGPRKKKKKECIEEGKSMGAKKKGRVLNGSGMAETVSQPRRPQ
jgi:hypothetical protein